MSKRTDQVGDEIQRILGEAIQYEMKDPRLGFVTVTGVTVTPDLQRANVRVAIMGDPEERKATYQILQRARGFLRRRIGEEMSLRYIPEVSLHLDTSLDYAMRIGEVLRDVEQEREINPPNVVESLGETEDAARAAEDDEDIYADEDDGYGDEDDDEDAEDNGDDALVEDPDTRPEPPSTSR